MWTILWRAPGLWARRDPDPRERSGSAPGAGRSGSAGRGAVGRGPSRAERSGAGIGRARSVSRDLRAWREPAGTVTGGSVSRAIRVARSPRGPWAHRCSRPRCAICPADAPCGDCERARCTSARMRPTVSSRLSRAAHVAAHHPGGRAWNRRHAIVRAQNSRYSASRFARANSTGPDGKRACAARPDHGRARPSNDCHAIFRARRDAREARGANAIAAPDVRRRGSLGMQSAQVSLRNGNPRSSPHRQVQRQ